MGRMMPGRVRAQGIALYEEGKLVVKETTEESISFEIDGVLFSYWPKDDKMVCACGDFTQCNYCPHLAAVEYFLKNDQAGKQQVDEVVETSQQRQEWSQKLERGRQFLDKVLAKEDQPDLLYQLSVQGQLLLYDETVDWSLSIRRLPDQRSYAIRDVAAFLRAVREKSHFQMGKNYYEIVSYERFDETSQQVLDLLFALLPAKPRFHAAASFFAGRYLRLPHGQLAQGLELFQDLPDFQIQIGKDSYLSLPVEEVTAAADLYAVVVNVEQEFIALHIEEKVERSLAGGAFHLKEGILYQANYAQQQLIGQIQEFLAGRTVGQMELDLSEQHRLAVSLLDFETIGPVTAPKAFRLEAFEPTFYLSRAGTSGLELQVVLEVAGQKIRSREELEGLSVALHQGKLDQLFARLQELGFGQGFSSQRTLSPDQAYAFFEEDLPRLRAWGKVVLDVSVSDLVGYQTTRLSLQSSGSLLDIAFEFDGIEEEEIQAALSALLQEVSHYVTRTGRILIFDQESRRISQVLQDLRIQHQSGGHLQISRLHLPHLVGQLPADQLHLAADLQQLTADLADPATYPAPNYQVTSPLRDYQLTGVKWLSILHRYGFGGILADDMGLGKTLQTIAFLTAHLTEESRVLILAPASLIYNWQEEFHRFAPQLDVAVVYGNKAERETLLAQNHQIVVTSYASFRQDSDLYAQQEIDMLFLDEAQVMKNASTKIAQQLRAFDVQHCYALSGTPIENHLKEIWSIFEIVLPGLLPSQARFSKLPAEQVARLIQPFILRRRKEDVLIELPDLMEMTSFNELTDEQKVIYLAQLQQLQAGIVSASDAAIQARKIEILAGITRLRQICDTPALFMEDYKGDSGKLANLRQLLLQLKEGGHRVLIFSQFRQMLERIEKELVDLDMTSYTLTGSTPAAQRQQMTKAFNAGSRDAFLISLKAGGVGLNLTGADTVILVDLWWNPAVEAQAIGRAHRMGQTETVEVFRLITRGTIEEKIQELQETKKHLVTTVLDGNEERASLTVEEIRAILGIS